MVTLKVPPTCFQRCFSLQLLDILLETFRHLTKTLVWVGLRNLPRLERGGVGWVQSQFAPTERTSGGLAVMFTSSVKST